MSCTDPGNTVTFETPGLRSLSLGSTQRTNTMSNCTDGLCVIKEVRTNMISRGCLLQTNLYYPDSCRPG